MGGSAAQKTLKILKVSAFYDPLLRHQISSKGGINSQAFRDSSAQSARGKKGGKKNAGTCWITDGLTSFKYKPTQQQSLETYLTNNPHLARGRNFKKRNHK